MVNHIYRISWLYKETKKVAINPINKSYDECFQYPGKIASNLKDIGKNSQRVEKVELFIGKYKGNGVIYPPVVNGWKRF